MGKSRYRREVAAVARLDFGTPHGRDDRRLVSLPAAVSCCNQLTAKDSPQIGRSRVGGNPIPWSAVKGATAVVPSPAWSPGRRGETPLAAAPVSSFQAPIGQVVHMRVRSVYIPNSCDHSNSPRAHALCTYQRPTWDGANVVGAHQGLTGCGSTHAGNPTQRLGRFSRSAPSQPQNPCKAALKISAVPTTRKAQQ